MAEITLDQAVVEKLTQFKGPVTVRDASGRAVGYFTPASAVTTPQRHQIPISQEELDRRARQGGGRPLEAILADLKKHA
jgi:hypothetical protein